jgi:hypothetical protein
MMAMNDYEVVILFLSLKNRRSSSRNREKRFGVEALTSH